MIRPLDLLLQRQPPVVVTPGLHRATGLWAQAEGVVRPFVRVDRLVEGRAGFEALMFHEALHVHERHALVGLVLLCLGLFAATVAFALGEYLSFMVCPAAGILAWILWRREQEVRADAFALVACATTAADPAKGLREFSAFVLLHEHPTARFWRWCYGRNPAHRVERAVARAGRMRWAGVSS